MRDHTLPVITIGTGCFQHDHYDSCSSHEQPDRKSMHIPQLTAFQHLFDAFGKPTQDNIVPYDENCCRCLASDVTCLVIDQLCYEQHLESKFLCAQLMLPHVQTSH